MKECLETNTRLDEAADALEAGLAFAPAITNADLIDKIKSLRLDLKLCDADKTALRSWKEQVNE